ncbi:hypothetical protein [Acinetobacter soli]|uniref:hypothetical protein n=1 Tax=Acinetobacter soli TaxID=487316 RepID=UPI000DD02FA4|nr:hypothetical protein [Acinetobacter soli]RSB50883.1 hypothetical protein EGK59_14880 [Acinetobacter soli]
MNSAEQIVTKKSQGIEVRHVATSDDQELRKMVSLPMTTRGLTLSFQREPSYFKASQVIYTQIDSTVAQDHSTGSLVGCYNIGLRPCYVNGTVMPFRYGGDLRLSPQVRGKAVLKQMTPHFKTSLKNPDFCQMIIFDDNIAARRAIQSGRLGFHYFDEGLIETLTLTGFKHAQFPKTLLHAKQSIDLSKLKRCVATAAHIEQMNAFIQQMAAYYNFIPAYDFAQLLHNDPYFQGLTLDDFQLYFEQDRLVGMFGLWNQSGFKQSKVLDYSKKIQTFRPLYNVWAKLNGRIQLPKKGQSFKYHILHSLLCEPEQLALHDAMLRDAFKLSKQRGIDAITFTLSHKDPRQRLNAYYKGDVLVGMHGFLTFEQDPRAQFDVARIPFLEAGRI